MTSALTPARPPDPALLQLVTQLGRALKATRFYDPRHAIVVNLLAEAHKALETLLRAGPFTLGAVGTTLLAEAGPLEAPAIREVAGALAGTLSQRSVAALRFTPGVTPDELGALLSALAPAPDEVRARGGVLGQLALSGITAINAVEVDLHALQAAEAARLDQLTAGDPVALLAVKRTLQLEKGKKPGDAVLPSLAADAGAAELGQLYEQLVRKAAVLTAGQLAQLVTSAFEQVLKGPRGAAPQEAQAALAQLGHALLQLGPEARFKALVTLARADAEGAPRPGLGGQPVAASLGVLLTDKAVAELVAVVLAGQGDADELGSLLAQLRPESAARQALLEKAAQGLGPEAAALLARLQQGALSGGALAERYLPVPLRESLPQLQAAAQAARVQAGDAQEGLAALLRDAEPLATAHFTAAAWVKLSREPEGLAQIEGAGQELIEWLEDNHDFAAGVKLAFAVADACEKARPPRRELIHQLFSGAAGVPRAERLLVEGAPPRPWISVALEPLVFHGAKAAVRPKLVAALAAQGEQVLPRLRAHFADASPAALSLALEIATAVSPPKTLAFCRELLRQGSREARAAAVRALARLSADPGALVLLATLSGAEGDKHTAAALRLEGGKDPAELRALQREAASALGASKSESAVAPLAVALHRTALFGDKELEPLRLAAATALGELHVAGVAAARAALERGAHDAKGKARELCARALERRP